MWRKIGKIVVICLSILTIVIVWSMESWSRTAHGKLPSKTAVILHAVNNNLVPLNSDIQPPRFLLSNEHAPKRVLQEKDIIIEMKDGAGIPARIYRYEDATDVPVILYYHGGAFLEGYGNIDTHRNITRALAKRTGAVVISPGYRLAPKHVFPKAVEDSYRALEWAYENAKKYGGDPNQIAVMGDSAGGNLATVMALKARDQNGPPLFAQVLFYPLTTFQDIKLESRETYDSGYYFLSRDVMLKAREAYAPEEEMWSSPYASPLHVDDLSGLPPTLIITAQFDPLRDEGELYGERLHEAGVPVETVRYNGVMHGFVSLFEMMESGEMALAQATQFLMNENKKQVPDDYQWKVQHAPQGIVRLKEEAESFFIAAFLLYQSLRISSS